ncbi:winged helix-turn-helix transcriptional regulator [Herpetosiphon llansteffanensis]|uniref:winged helix-turn-helix transcriptional regulator n=1 Tax=Herpetosiphon llansteffanensis TaxID=2094568 RepID=UPI003D4FDA2C
MDCKGLNRMCHDYGFSYSCPVEATIAVIGGKWKCVILFHLCDGKKRFSQLQRFLPEITQRMLTLQLRELEADGVISRTVYAEVPPRVEYALTEFGESLRPILFLMRDWGQEYRDTIVDTKSRQASQTN